MFHNVSNFFHGTVSQGRFFSSLTATEVGSAKSVCTLVGSWNDLIHVAEDVILLLKGDIGPGM